MARKKNKWLLPVVGLAAAGGVIALVAVTGKRGVPKGRDDWDIPVDDVRDEHQIQDVAYSSSGETQYLWRLYHQPWADADTDYLVVYRAFNQKWIYDEQAQRHKKVWDEEKFDQIYFFSASRTEAIAKAEQRFKNDLYVSKE